MRNSKWTRMLNVLTLEIYDVGIFVASFIERHGVRIGRWTDHLNSRSKVTQPLNKKNKLVVVVIKLKYISK